MKYVGWGVALVVWAVLPFVLPRHAVDLLVFCGLYAIAGAGVGFLLGQGGICNMGQAAFYGFGAYSSAYCTVELGWPAPAGFAVGLACSIGLAYLIGRPILRLSGYFLALATLAVSIICSNVFYEAETITGGTLGIPGVPKLDFWFTMLDRPEKFYFLVWIVAFGCVFAMHNLMHSRIGLAMQAMRDSPEAAKVMAIDIATLRLWMFMISSALGSLAGSLFAHYASFVNVDSFGVERSIILMLVPVIGGASAPAGVLVGGLFIGLVPEFLSRLGDIHRVMFGLALVATVVFFPDGLYGLVVQLVAKVRARLASGKTETAK